MKSFRRIQLLALLNLCLVARSGGDSIEGCRTLSEDVRAKIAAYSAAHYELAPDLRIVDGGNVDGTCFRRVRVESSAPQRTLDLFLSPDQRFLTESLFDTTSNPALERLRVARATEAALLTDPSPSRGPRDATVTIVEFSDFECPFCKRFEQFLSDASDPRQPIRVVFKQLPLSIHPWARRAAIASVCAGVQGDDAFWRLGEFMMQSQETITLENVDKEISGFASRSEGIDATRLKDCLLERSDAEKVLERDAKLGELYHVNATPTVFINGVRKPGFRSADELRSAIKAAASPAVDPNAPNSGSERH